MPQLPNPAQYLLRVDDLCPTVDRGRWQQIRSLILDSGIRPILAVVPDNRDPQLAASSPDPTFWDQMRSMQEAGATIALHGFRHLCQSEGKSLVRLHRRTEFAGHPSALQRDWIHRGLHILRNQNLRPKLWVAPRHSFDLNTLRALREEGIHYLSDGMARRPFVRGGVTWIPQQLWSPTPKSHGLWTICIHPNIESSARLEQLQAFVTRHAGQFTSFDRIAQESAPEVLDTGEWLYEKVAMWRVRWHRKRVHRRRYAF